MAVTERYVDPAGGNDYIGASFTDGAYTSATKTLVKNGAFTANKANHYLYLQDNGSTNIVDGYYKIATWTDANTVILATDAGGGSNATDVKCTQADGSSSLPFHTVQGALDLTTRNSTDGDRINVKAGTADVLNATLSLTTYGTPAIGAVLIVQGYTSSAGDGGIGEIDGNAGNFAIIDLVSASKGYVYLIDLKLGNTGTASVLTLSTSSVCQNCELHTSSNADGVASTNYNVLVGCWLHDFTGADAFQGGTSDRVINCFFDVTPTGTALNMSGTSSVVVGNIVDVSGADTSVTGISAASGSTVYGNTIFCSNANTSRGIYASSDAVIVMNNIVEGWSGTGGDGIETVSTRHAFVGANAVYNCTSPITIGAAKLNYAIAPNDTLDASPFTDAANDDFSIKDSQTGVTEDAYPSTFRGL